ncbi:MAG: pyruvate formate lyase family protein [bacterium]
MSTDAISERAAKAAKIAASFATILQSTEPVVHRTGLLAGPVGLNFQKALEKLGDWPWLGDDNLHFPMNIATLLKLGFSGIETTARSNAKKLSGDQAAYLLAIADTHKAAGLFIAAHAQAAESAAGSAGADAVRLKRIAGSCFNLAQRPPSTFLEAVQLFWFAYVIRGRGTIGRLDQHLNPFYQADLKAGRITRMEALGILSALWDLINIAGSGDTLANIMLGGQDRDGNDSVNDVSYLIIDVTIAHRGTDPHVNVRVHSNSPQAWLEKIAGLQLDGRGKGTVYNDELIVAALGKVGVAPASARNYTNDGCSEITIDGEGTIRIAEVDVLKSLELALFNGEQNIPPGEPVGKYWTRNSETRRVGTNLKTGYVSGDFSGMKSFEQFFEAFWDQYRYQLQHELSDYCHGIEYSMVHGLSAPFMAGTFPKVLETGKELECVSIHSNFVFAGSIPTAADSLMAIRKVVFEDAFCTPGELLAALKADFEGHEPLRQRLAAAPKFGNDLQEVDTIAAELVKRFCAFVKGFPTLHGPCLWPCLFYHSFNDGAKIVCATPDGRKWRDPVGEHFSPVPGRARRGPTAVIRSVTRAPLSEAAGTATFNLSLSRSIVPRNAAGAAVLKDLVAAALKLGTGVMNISIYDVQVLKDAKIHPEKYGDLQVRVWGYSARFTDLDNDMQDHVIARAISES